MKRIPRHFSTAQANDPVVQASAPAPFAPATSLNFNGVGNGFGGPAGAFTVNSAPPDTNGAVGPEPLRADGQHAISPSSTRPAPPSTARCRATRCGAASAAAARPTTTAIRSSSTTSWPTAGSSSQFSVQRRRPYLQCVAVSTDRRRDRARTTGTRSRTATTFPDYPKIGVWPDALLHHLQHVHHGNAFAGRRGRAPTTAPRCSPGSRPRSSASARAPPSAACCPPTWTAPRRRRPARPNFIVNFGTSTRSNLWKFHVDWPPRPTRPSPARPACRSRRSTPACDGGTCVPQPGTTPEARLARPTA